VVEVVLDVVVIVELLVVLVVGPLVVVVVGPLVVVVVGASVVVVGVGPGFLRAGTYRVFGFWVVNTSGPNWLFVSTVTAKSGPLIW
jgi:hypothetical protein